MCGIVAAFGLITPAIEKAMKDLLVFDQVRGEHSTGLAFVNRGNPIPDVVKAVGPAHNLFEMKKFDAGMMMLNRALIGHNRYATVGKINAANAHPFQMGNVTGVHNGSLRYYKDLDGYGEYEVDSQVLYNHIDQHGLADAVANFSGAAALVWWNEQTCTINVYRNEERPLSYALVEDGSAMFLASEGEMIALAARRNKVKILEIKEVPPHMHFAWDVPNGFTGKLTKPAATRIEPRTPVITYGGASQYYGSFTSQDPQTTTQGQTVSPPQTYSQLPSGVRMAQLYDTRTLWDVLYGVFVEVDGVQEYVLPYEVCKQKGFDVGDTVEGKAVGRLYGRAVAGQTQEQFWRFDVNTVTKVVPTSDEDEPYKDQLVTDHKGRLIPLKEWNKQYGTCSFCDGDISHTDKFLYVGEEAIMCEECVSSK